MTTLRVEPGDATNEMVRDAWTEVLEEIGRSGDARKTVDAYGGDPDSLAAAKIKVEEVEGDFGLTLAISIGAPVAAHVLKGLWDDLVRPRIRSRWGKDAGEASD
jgi:hypothetical protein